MARDGMALLWGYVAHQRVRGFSARTIGRRRWAVRLWVEYAQAAAGGLELAGVEELEAFLSRWPSATSRQAVRSDVRQFHRWAIARGALSSDPTDKLPAPRLPKRAPSPVPAEDVLRLLAATTGTDRLAVMLWAYAGLRASEISRLRGEDIDLQARRLIVRSGKGAKDDTLPIAGELARELELAPSRGRLVPVRAETISGRISRLMARWAQVDHEAVERLYEGTA